MSIEDAYNSLRWSLARDSRENIGPIKDEHWAVADTEIDAMSNTELLEALARHEDRPE